MFLTLERPRGGGGGRSNGSLFLVIFLFKAVKTCFQLISRKLAAVLLKIAFLKSPRWWPRCGGHVVK